MITSKDKNLVKKSLFANNIVAACLILLYVGVYGISSQLIMNGLNLMFFICSLIYTLGVMYVRDPEVQRKRAKKGIIGNQILGVGLIATYLLVFGVSSVVLFTGLQLIFFMTSYIFALSFFYLRDPKRLEKEQEQLSYSQTMPVRHPCHINREDLTWLVKDLNESLSSIIGFTELLLNREFNDNEKDYMLRDIHDKALTISHAITKASALVDDSLTLPKDLVMHRQNKKFIEKEVR